MRAWREGISGRRKSCEGRSGLRGLGRFGQSFTVDRVVSHSVEIRLEREVVVRSQMLLSVAWVDFILAVLDWKVSDGF